MGFVAICTAVYDYHPQGAGELELQTGELLYILEKSTDDDWWKAKKKAHGDDDEEPEGLIPNNYVEEAKPTYTAKALYDYERQTDEEVSFTEDATLEVFDTSDQDWTLVGFEGEYGFAPANYIELSDAETSTHPASPALPTRPQAATPERASSPVQASPTRSVHGPAASLASVLSGGAPTSPTANRALGSPSATRQQFTPEASDEEEEDAPALPQRPPSQTLSPSESLGVLPSPPYNRAVADQDEDTLQHAAGGFHLYNVSEMVSSMGRRKKLPVTLGLNIATGTIMLSPEKSRDGPSQEWSAERLTHYSIEGKHVFLELVRPSKSLDLHAGASDTAKEIVAALGEIAGAQRAEGFKEVVAAATSTGTQKKGNILYDFMAQGDDEVTVAEGDEVIILDDTKSEDWWQVRRLKNGTEGVVPSSYIEITGTISTEPTSRSGLNAGRSTVDQNRLEEERLAKEAARSNRGRGDSEASRALPLPQRGSSLMEEQPKSSKRDKRSSRSDKHQSKSKPDPTKTRMWTDHSGSFKVEAQFIGMSDGKIHLHKTNGIKIAVPVSKMSPEDLEYIEKVTHESVEDNIPLADLIKIKRQNEAKEASRAQAGASVQPTGSDQPKGPEYDWFDFFLKAGVQPFQCERYSQAMVRDSMDESVLADITQETLRHLGLKEGDALKVMKYLDQRYNRSKPPGPVNGDGGIFAGPGGVLRNNTGRSRPETNRQTTDVVDPKAFETGDSGPKAEGKATPLTQAPAREPRGGFDDDAWEVKPSTQSAPRPQPAPAAAPAPAPRPPTGALADLSLLDQPLQPTPAAPPQPQNQASSQAPPQSTPATFQQSAPQAAVQQLQQTGANPAFFAQVGQQQTAQSQVPQVNAPQFNPPRQRPQPPQSFTGSALLPPPPRPTSAPQNFQPNQFGLQPLQPQLTGMPRNALHPAPPGQTLDDLTAQRMQQYSQLAPQPTGFGQPQNLGSFTAQLASQPTGFQQQQPYGQFQQPYLNGNATGSPFADPRPNFQPQPTGFGSFQQNPSAGGVNSMLPPALTPQRTGFTSPLQQSQTNGFSQPQAFQLQPTGFQQGFQSQPTGFGQPQSLQPQQTGFGQPQPFQPQQTGFQPQQNGFGNFQVPPVPPLPSSITPAPLVAQKTGPAPPIRFGLEAKKLTPQPTGRRANLAHATPDNPFGF